jgi:hypothetical protein
MRAVTQNRPWRRRWASAPPRIDALTFGLGSGIAGMAGVALSQIDNVSPNLGQGYIIDSFMVVVFGGVGNLWGTLVGALTLGIANKFLEPYAGAVLGKIACWCFIICSSRSGRAAVRAQGPGGRGMIVDAMTCRRGCSLASTRRDRLSDRAVGGARRSWCRCSTSGAGRNPRRCTCRPIWCRCSANILLRDAGAGDRPDLGLLRHPEPRPRRLLRARRLRHGHVSDAPDRHPRRLRQSDPAGLHGVPELEGTAVVLVRLQFSPMPR